MTGGTWFQRILLPGLAFKAVVIGGGYATGRELVEFFMPSGPLGGVYGMLLAMAIWSVVSAVTFAFALVVGAEDYRTFFKALLGRFWPVYEIVYVLFIVLILAVFAAASGAIGAAIFGWPPIVGTLCLIASIAALTTYGNDAVERLFKYASIFIYSVYAIFIVLALSSFGARIGSSLALPVPTDGWPLAGLTYAGYNVVAAVVVLPVLRHMRGRRDAIAAGLLTGPLAMLPALLFFVCMAAWYPEISGETLPSDYLLQRMDAPVFHYFFQLMIFSALLETAAASVNAVNERVAAAWQQQTTKSFGRRERLAIASVLLVSSVFLADRFGLVSLIASGYRAFTWIFLAIFVLPLLTRGTWLLWRGRDAASVPAI